MYKYLFGLIALILINACKHEFEQPSWTTHWTAPLAHSSLSINQLQQGQHYLLGHTGKQ